MKNQGNPHKVSSLNRAYYFERIELNSLELGFPVCGFFEIIHSANNSGKYDNSELSNQ